MTDIRQEVIKELEEHKDELIISSFRIGRFLGIAEDENDIYYVLQAPGRDNFHFVSAVMKIGFLKNRIPEEDYEYIERLFNLNSTSVEQIKENVKEMQCRSSMKKLLL